MNTKKLAARNKRARRNLALKIQLENPFKRELIGYFNRLNKKVFEHYIDSGQVLSVPEWQDTTVGLLRKQYKRVARSFTNEMRLFVSKNLDMEYEQENESTAMFLITKQDDEKIKDVVNAAVAIFVVDQANLRSQEIDKTTANNINDSIREATSKITSQGKELTRGAVGLLASRIFKRKNKGRINSIAMTETQFSAEKAKRIEARAIEADGNVRPVDLASGAVLAFTSQLKEWAAVLDQSTRGSHAQADGQKVLSNLPFVVQGELLMEPSDSSLGASASNTINCRCSALYF